MLTFFQCVIDLPANCLRIGDGDESIPFLAEKDIPAHLRKKTAEDAGQIAEEARPADSNVSQ